MGVTFFVSWQLWQQMTFVLAGCMIIVIGVGWMKNVYSWRKDRRYARRLKSKAKPGWTHVSNDLEARDMAEIDDIPFGIKALQLGVQVEGIWISQPTTPVQTPPPGSPLISGKPSPVPSLIGTMSMQSSPSDSITPSEVMHGDFKMARPEMVRTSRIPSFALDAALPDFIDEESHIRERMSTLEALEGRSLSLDDIQRQYMRSYRRTDSASQSMKSDGISTRNSSPSPPDLTDGTTQSETTNSTSRRPQLSAYLSESSHRMSHVAETGQIHPRIRWDKVYTPSISNDARSFSHPGVTEISVPAGVNHSSSTIPVQLSKKTPRSSKAAPSTFTPRRASHETRQSRFDGSTLPVFAPRHIRAITSTQVIAGQEPSPILFEYMSSSVDREMPAAAYDDPPRHTMHDAISSCSFTQQQHLPSSKAPQSAMQIKSAPDSDQFRKVNANFEVGRGARGSLALPIDLPSLSQDQAAGSDKRKSKKLQKKASRAQSMI